ncbi:probable lipoprotein NlpC [Methylomarinovum tepidoasis]|uniref:Probable lipoprotein NlpC n=1 Tax=Methylomarinovum tepidoasis TaxID=2840183 RepID=A0AAU9C779_9GAMM|nr:C40 family peptidase [Methylomarinovum sp. IN45]BCX89104.1 probable lipoprotein NlpC [Methylomarinovum sp. IN45]
MRQRIQAHLMGLGILASVLGGCAAHPSRPAASATHLGARIAAIALRYQGVPYRYGGNDPSGFDCSGLVQFTHRRFGLDVPRAARQQWRHARKIPAGALQPGDLLFFRPARKGWHVGDGNFVHAPSRGKRVRTTRLNRYWWRHFIGAGRYW